MKFIINYVVTYLLERRSETLLIQQKRKRKEPLLYIYIYIFFFFWMMNILLFFSSIEIFSHVAQPPKWIKL